LCLCYLLSLFCCYLLSLCCVIVHLKKHSN
jgi:hypothetical protein